MITIKKCGIHECYSVLFGPDAQFVGAWVRGFTVPVMHPPVFKRLHHSLLLGFMDAGLH